MDTQPSLSVTERAQIFVLYFYEMQIDQKNNFASEKNIIDKATQNFQRIAFTYVTVGGMKDLAKPLDEKVISLSE